jgi:hypothetical protein
MEEKVTSFLGFTFNNIHSSELGIVRIISNGRFNINLLPDMSDKIMDNISNG